MASASQGPLEQLGVSALRYVKPGYTIGLGTGRAASAFILALGESGMKVRGVPTSDASEQLGRDAGIEIVRLADVKRLDADFDGADEVDPRLNLIKGYGGALVREKVVAASSKRFVVLVGPEKLVPRLGAHKRLPVEVVPFAREYAMRAVAKLKLKATVRKKDDGSDFVSDNGNLILDCAVREIRNPAQFERVLLSIPGVIGTGLFIAMADLVLVAPADGTPLRILKRRRRN